MAIQIDEADLKHSVLGLAIALIEIIRDALQTQALRRVENGGLTDTECERLGNALMELDATIEEIKEEQGIAGSVRAVREQLDSVVDDLISGSFSRNNTRDRGERRLDQ